MEEQEEALLIREMASYEAIKNFEDDEDDVEMALPHSQISESRSQTLSSTIAETTPLNIHNVQEQLSTSSRNQPQTVAKPPRLVSLDVFRGLTVAVITLILCVLFYFFIFLFLFYFTVEKISVCFVFFFLVDLF